MITEKQLEANRANAQHSTGPKTDEGKQRSSLNAARHGLTMQVSVMPHEDMEIYKQFIAEIVESLELGNVHEQQLGVSYANLQWRINRAAAIEDTMLTLGVMEKIAENLNIAHPEAHNATSYAKTFRDQSEVFGRISLYNQRNVNAAAKILKQLKELQAERRYRQELAMNEATRIYKFQTMCNEVFDPQENGFDFSLDQIKAHSRRHQLKTCAEIAENVGYILPKYEKLVQKSAA